MAELSKKWHTHMSWQSLVITCREGRGWVQWLRACLGHTPAGQERQQQEEAARTTSHSTKAAGTKRMVST